MEEKRKNELRKGQRENECRGKKREKREKEENIKESWKEE